MSAANLTILEPGLCTLVVDHGRPRTRSLGVSVGGAADRFALAIGNALVGNAANTAALEICLVGPRLVADAPLACVLFGASFEIRTERVILTSGKTFTLQPGDPLRVGGATSGARAYLCVRGGFETSIVLDSRSSLAPLQTGDILSCQSGTIESRFIELDQEDNRTLRVLKGGQADWFPDSILTQQSFVVTPASSRMGIRLRGDPLPVPPREMVSEPVCPGAIQVTRDGQCILLGVDGQTIGGYPKVAHVIDADLDRVGQLRPGEHVQFEYVTLEKAASMAQQRVAILREWQVRLRTMGASD